MEGGEGMEGGGGEEIKGGYFSTRKAALHCKNYLQAILMTTCLLINPPTCFFIENGKNLLFKGRLFCTGFFHA